MTGQTEEVYHFTQICEALYRRGTMENKMIVKYSNKKVTVKTILSTLQYYVH